MYEQSKVVSGISLHFDGIHAVAVPTKSFGCSVSPIWPSKFWKFANRAPELLVEVGMTWLSGSIGETFEETSFHFAHSIVNAEYNEIVTKTS